MPRTRLFVSHSSKTDENLALLAGVCNALAGAGYHVLVDKGGEIADGAGHVGEIHAGEDWALRLDEWMAECHAAVILCSKDALESYWVQREAAILSWRRRLDPGFRLIPVLLDGLAAERLDEGVFGASAIAASQAIRHGAEADEIAARIGDALGPPDRTSRTPYDRLARAVERIFATAGAGALEDAWDAIEDGEKPPFRPERGDRLAGAFARFALRAGKSALLALKKALGEIHPRLARDRARELLGLLDSLWIDAEAAGLLPAAAEHGGCAALNARYFTNLTAECYAKRAWLLESECRRIPVDDWSTPGAVRERLRTAFDNPASPADAETLDRRLARHRGVVVALLAPAAQGLPDAGLLEALRGLRAPDRPPLAVLVGTGDAPPEAPGPGVHVVRPPLDLETEAEVYDARDDLEQWIASNEYLEG